MSEIRTAVLLILGRVSFGLVCGAAVLLTHNSTGLYVYEEDVKDAFFLPLVISPILALVCIAIIPGKRAVVASSIVFVLSFLCSPKGGGFSALVITAFIFAAILGQAGWWQVIRNSDHQRIQVYDAVLFGGGLLLSLTMESTILMAGVFAAGMTVVTALIVDYQSTYQATTIEKAFNHIMGAIRALMKDGWSLRILGFFLVLSIALLSLLYPLFDFSAYGGQSLAVLLMVPLYFAVMLAATPWIGKLGFRFRLKLVSGVCCTTVLVLSIVAQWFNDWFYFWIVMPITVLLVAILWRRLVCELAITLPSSMRYLAEPFLIISAGLAGFLGYLGLVSGVEALDDIIYSYTPFFFGVSSVATIGFLCAAVLAFILELPDRALIGEGGEVADTIPIPSDHWYFPGQNPMIRLPRGHDTCVVTIAYSVLKENHRAFEKLLPEVGKIRRRAGAIGWQATVDPEDDRLWREHFTVDSWADYTEAIKHENERDRSIKQELFNLNDWESLPMEEHLPIRVS